MTTVNRQNSGDEKTGEVSVEVAVGSNWDVKELVFRDPGTQERAIMFKNERGFPFIILKVNKQA